MEAANGPGQAAFMAASQAADGGMAFGANKARYGNLPLFIPSNPAVPAVGFPNVGKPSDQPEWDMEVQPIQAPQMPANMPTKRERKPLVIVNPDTNKAVDSGNIERERKEREHKPSTETANEIYMPVHALSSQSIVIKDPKTHEVVHVARTPHERLRAVVEAESVYADRE